MLKLFFQLIILLGLSSSLATVYAATPKTAIESRVDNMSRLLNESSGAKQVINGFNDEARSKREAAVNAFEKARQSLLDGDNEGASQLLNQTAKLMFEAIKLSTPTTMTEDKVITDYRQRKQSVNALRDAFNRISDENNEEDSKSRVNQQLEKIIFQADKLLDIAKSTEARLEIDKAYHLLKVSIEAIRSGQTLVRSLQFENPQDEYEYEIDRNDTHSMLVGLLVDENKQSAVTKKNIEKNVDHAKILRKQAESYATNDAYEQAIELLEQSTKQLVRAIRSAGIYIPG